jgi:hypothetical protein
VKKSASCIVINPGAILCVINQSTLVIARVHIIRTSIRSYSTVELVMCPNKELSDYCIYRKERPGVENIAKTCRPRWNPYLVSGSVCVSAD